MTTMLEKMAKAITDAASDAYTEHVVATLSGEKTGPFEADSVVLARAALLAIRGDEWSYWVHTKGGKHHVCTESGGMAPRVVATFSSFREADDMALRHNVFQERIDAILNEAQP